MDKIVALCKRRGFLYPGSDIYGGLANTWDFGHYGLLLKNNLRDSWWKKFVLEREDMIGIDTSSILNPKVWQASGHVTGFNDALVDCRDCRFRTRADHLIEEKLKKKVEGLSVVELTRIIKENKLKCPNCGSLNLTDVRKFNLLFKTHVGIIEESKSEVYLRGELAQGIIINFKNALDTLRVRIPFGIASQGKVFRNEITMGQSAFRTLEFDLMEFEYFIDPQSWEKTYIYWQEVMWAWAKELGLSEERIRWREHEAFERSHYSKKTMDVEYKYPFGWKEMWGIAYRTDYDLKNHMQTTGKDMNYFDPIKKSKYVPHIIEPTFGLSRLAITIITDAYCEQEVNGKLRVYLKISPRLAPIKVAVFPLQKDDKLFNIAKSIFKDLKVSFTAEFDDAGNIGKMYRRQDEIGTPYCITVDYQSITDQTVTVRERDSMKQERVNINQIKNYLTEKLSN